MSIFKRWRKWSQDQKTIRELQKLDDRELMDMGINRSMIEKAVKATNKDRE